MENLVHTPTHYVWEIAGKPISIHVDFDVVDRLSMEVMRGFGAVPRRGAEVGGVLLGTVEAGERLIVRIEDFEVVPCEHRRGPSFLLSEADEQRFDDSVSRWRNAPDKRMYAIGFYRSHTREGLGLSEEDMDMFQRYFPDPSNVVLLIRPYATKTSVGAFFFEEEGQIRRDASYLEFPFRRRDLGGGSAHTGHVRGTLPVESMVDSPVAAEAAPRAGFAPEVVEGEADAAPGDELRNWYRTPGQGGALSITGGSVDASLEEEGPETRSSRFRGKWVWIPLSFIFLLLGVILGFQAALVLNKTDSSKQVTDNYLLSLQAEKAGDSVVVRWDRRSAPIRNARGGALLIKDGDFSKNVELDARQLQNGSVIYRNADSRITFRLEVYPLEHSTVSETLEYVPAK